MESFSYLPSPTLRTFGAVCSRNAPLRSSGGSTPWSKMRICVLDVALQHGHVAAEAHRPDARLVQQLEELLLELRDVRIRVARPDGTRDRLLGEIHRVVRGTSDADADDPRRARLAPRADDRLEHELLDPFHAVGRHTHLEEAHVLAARSLRHTLDVEPAPVGDEVPVHDRKAVGRIRSRVLT